MPKYKDCRAFITALGTSVPPHRFPQASIGEFMKKYMVLDDKRRRWVDQLVLQSQIRFRHSVIPDYGKNFEDFTFYPNNPELSPFPGVGRRMAYYKEKALPLAVEAANACLNNADTEVRTITHLIVVSCTGMYAPGLDIELVQTMGMRGNVERTCINFMGCYAAFNALKVAATITQANPDARVLIVCVELCSLHFQKEGADTSNLITNMLFGDGASAALIEGKKKEGKLTLAMINFASDLIPEGASDMTWEISDFGFVMNLTNKVPSMLSKGVESVFKQLNDQNVYIDHYVFHPGGPRVLEALQAACHLENAALNGSYEILKEYGNMSSATLFFILQRLIRNAGVKSGEYILSAAFGPGLTCESALLRVTN